MGINDPTTSGGAVDTWEISPSIATLGLSFSSSTGRISGTPLYKQTTAVTYTVWANNSGGSTSTQVNITINDELPGPFEYIPENHTLIKDMSVSISPSFINEVSGNGSTWLQSSVSNPGSNFALEVNDVLYFSGEANAYLWAHDKSNETTWKVNNSVTMVGEHLAYAVNDVLYFSAYASGIGGELFAYSTINQTMWLVAELVTGVGSSNPGENMAVQSGDLIFFRAYNGAAWRLHVLDTNNQTVWEVSYSFNQIGYYGSSPLLSEAIGDTVYFAG